MKRTLLILILVTLLPAQGFAAQSDWIEIMAGAKLRAISAGMEMDGRALIGIEVELGTENHTYWRVPGETGLPTSVSVSGAGGARAADILWPLPEWETGQGYVDLVYRNAVTLPVLVDAPIGEPLRLDVTMGVCSDICVPVRATLDLPGDSALDPGNSLRLKQAVNQTPIAWEGADLPLTEIAFDRESGDLVLGFDPSRVDPQVVFPSLDGMAEVFAPPEIDTGAQRLRFTLMTSARDTGWRDAPLRLTFATSDGPYEIVRSSQTR